MQLSDIMYMTRLYTRDNNSYVFSDTMIKMFVNQGIDRIKQYKVFSGMKQLVDGSDKPTHLPESYHYMLALFAASRCFDHDERHYEGTEKRNEFEQLLTELISEIQAGNLTIYDGKGNEVVDGTICCMDAVKDVYFDYREGGVE